MLNALFILALLAMALAVTFMTHASLKLAIHRFIGILILCYGVLFSTLIGYSVSVILPGISSIAISAIAGAAIGFGIWLTIGILGLVAAGNIISLSMSTLAFMMATVGAIGAFYAPLSVILIQYFLVTPLIWGPLIIIAIYITFIKQIEHFLRSHASKSTD